jgi:hypothetical protein
MSLAKLARVAKQTLRRSAYGGLVTIFGLSGLVVAAPVIFSGSAAADSSNLYVNTSTGDDSHTCLDSSLPCRTISKAIQNANAGDTIIVAAGNYNENVSIYQRCYRQRFYHYPRLHIQRTLQLELQQQRRNLPPNCRRQHAKK